MGGKGGSQINANLPDIDSPQRAVFQYPTAPCAEAAPHRRTPVHTWTNSHHHPDPCSGTYKIW